MPQRLELKVNGSDIGDVSLRLVSFLGENETEIPECQRIQGEWINVHPWHPRGVNEMRIVDGIHSSELPCKVCISPGVGTEFGTCTFGGIELPRAWSFSGIDSDDLLSGTTGWNTAWSDIVSDGRCIGPSTAPAAYSYWREKQWTTDANGLCYWTFVEPPTLATEVSKWSVSQPMDDYIPEDRNCTTIQTNGNSCDPTYEEIVEELLDSLSGMIIENDGTASECAETFSGRSFIQTRLNQRSFGVNKMFPCGAFPYVRIILTVTAGVGEIDFDLNVYMPRLGSPSGSGGFGATAFSYHYTHDTADPLPDPMTLDLVSCPIAFPYIQLRGTIGTNQFTTIGYWLAVESPETVTLTAVD